MAWSGKDKVLAWVGLSVLAGCTPQCGGVGIQKVKVDYTINGQSPDAVCPPQGSVKVRSRWTDANNAVVTRESSAECSAGTITAEVGGAGSIQLTEYDQDGVVMGVSPTVDVDPTTPDWQPNDKVQADIVALRATLDVTVTCFGGSCDGQVLTSGDGAPTFSVLLDTNGMDLEPVEQPQPLQPAADGTLTGSTHRARKGAINVVRADARTPDGRSLHAETSRKIDTLTASVALDLREAVVHVDAGYPPVSSSSAVTSSGATSQGSSSAAGSSSSAAVTSSSQTESSSSAISTSSTSTSAGSSSGPSGSSSSAAGASSTSTEAPSSSVGATTSSTEGSSSSVEFSSSSSAAGESSSSVGESSSSGPPDAGVADAGAEPPDAGTPDAADAFRARLVIQNGAGGTLDLPGELRVDVPANGLSAATATLEIYDVHQMPVEIATYTPASGVYQLVLTGAALVKPMEIRVRNVAAVTRPLANVLGVCIDDVNWQVAELGSFYDGQDQLGATTTTPLVVAAFHRTLRHTTDVEAAWGKDVFFRTSFGNESHWSGSVASGGLALGTKVASPGVPLTPRQLLDTYGMKVDVDVLASHGVTVNGALLQDATVLPQWMAWGSVVGIKATAHEVSAANWQVDSLGIACALCHATVDDSAAPGVGHAVAGPPNKDLDLGKFMALSDAFSAGQKAALTSWGPGRFDIRALNPMEDGVTNATAIPALWDLEEMVENGYRLNWDGLFMDLLNHAVVFSYWVMGANGEYTGSGLNPAATLPNAVQVAFLAQDGVNDVPMSKMVDVVTFEESLLSPQPVAGTDYDAAGAERGWRVYRDQGRCLECHTADDFVSSRDAARANLVPTGTRDSHGVPSLFFPTGPLKGVRPAPLRGVRFTAPYFSDQSAATLGDAVDVHTAVLGVTLNASDRDDLLEYLRSL